MAGVTLSAGPVRAENEHHSSGIAAVREATEQYRTFNPTTGPYSTLVKTTDGTACITQPGEGAMGEHWANGAIVGDGKIKATKPEVLMYEPRKDGSRRLVGVEYVVLVSDWMKKHDDRPELFDQKFHYNSASNAFGLPPFYSLHAWIWKSNPSGMFYPWNPKVHCP
jgi:hypothetical protein